MGEVPSSRKTPMPEGGKDAPAVVTAFELQRVVIGARRSVRAIVGSEMPRALRWFVVCALFATVLVGASVRQVGSTPPGSPTVDSAPLPELATALPAHPSEAVAVAKHKEVVQEAETQVIHTRRALRSNHHSSGAPGSEVKVEPASKLVALPMLGRVRRRCGGGLAAVRSTCD